MGKDIDHGGLQGSAPIGRVAILPEDSHAPSAMPIHRTIRRLLWALIGLALALGTGIWLGRDLPRHWVEVLLAEQLGAEVKLESLTFEARDRFLLQGLSVGSSQSVPPLAAARIGSLRVHGGLQRLLAGEFPAVEVEDADLLLRPRAMPPAPEKAPYFQRVTLQDVRVRFADLAEESAPEAFPAATLPLWLEGTLRQVGRPGTEAEISFHGDILALRPVMALAMAGSGEPPPDLQGSLGGVEGSFRQEANGLTATIRGIRMEGGRGGEILSLEGPSAELTSAGGTLRALLLADQVTVPSPSGAQTLPSPRAEITLTGLEEPEAPGGDPTGRENDTDEDAGAEAEAALYLGGKSLGRLRARLEPTSFLPLRLEGELEGLPLGLFLPWLPPAGAWNGEGSVRLSLAPASSDHGDGGGDEKVGEPPQKPGGATAYRLSLHSPHLEATLPGDQRLRSRDLSAVVQGVLALPALRPRDAVEAEVRLRSLEGAWQGRTIPPGLFPLAARWHGTVGVTEAGDPLAAGTLTIETHRAGRFELSLPEAAPPGSSSQARRTAAWSWRGTAIPELLALAAEAGVAPPPALELAGALRGDGTLSWPGSWPSAEGLRAAGRLFLSQGKASGERQAEWQLTGLQGEVRWSLAERWRAELRDLRGDVRVEPLESHPFTLQAKLDGRTGHPALHLEGLRLDLPHLV
ncbi:MAG: hypothetical protein KDD47_19025, partial [Acidobacteria bacterium]|nr:hypothetical protein [Acidobacteriota bacterium]